jgi:hypothetical protein
MDNPRDQSGEAICARLEHLLAALKSVAQELEATLTRASRNDLLQTEARLTLEIRSLGVDASGLDPLLVRSTLTAHRLQALVIATGGLAARLKVLDAKIP